LTTPPNQNQPTNSIIVYPCKHGVTNYCGICEHDLTKGGDVQMTEGIPICPEDRRKLTSPEQTSNPSRGEEHNHSCSCGYGTTTPHELSKDGCCRIIVESPQKQQNDYWLVNGSIITGYSLRDQRGYHEHPCGCWSRPKDQGSENSIEA